MFKVNDAIVAELRAAGALLAYDPKFTHEYPHCWRCKNPVIFRATDQWFMRLDDAKTDIARARSRRSAARLGSRPGENRIAGMVENRRDWCVSRQRSWGVGIRALYANGTASEPRSTVARRAGGAGEVLRAAGR